MPQDKPLTLAGQATYTPDKLTLVNEPPPDRSLDNPLSRQMGGAIGAGKAVGRTVVNIGKLVDWLSSFNPIFGGVGGVEAIAPGALDAAKASLQPTNEAQRMGGTGANIGMALAAGGPVNAMSRTVATLVPRMLALPAEMAVQGGSAAAIAKLQDQNPVTAGVIGAAGPLASKGLELAGNALKQKAARSMILAMGPAGRQGPTSAEHRAIATRLAGWLVDRRFGALSQRGAAAKAGDFVDDAMTKLDDLLATVPEGQQAEIAPILKPLDEALASFNRSGVTAEGTQGADVVFDDRTVKALRIFRDKIAALGQTASIQTLRASRQDLDKVAAAAGGFGAKTGSELANARAWAAREAGGAIRAKLADDVPNLQEINQEVSRWINVQKVLAKAAAQPSGKAGLNEAAIAGAIVTLPAGSITAEGLAAGTTRALAALFRSPAWRYASANAKGRLADALASGVPEQITQAIAAFGASLTTPSPDSAPSRAALMNRGGS